jgi:hypothetical protein
MATIRGQGFGLIAAMLVTLSACSGGSGGGAAGSGSTGSPASSPVVVSGSVGDGPAVGATLQVTDADGRVLRNDRSSATADYRLELPVETRLPVLVKATGGTDLVTQRPLDFPLLGAVLATGNVTVNISPLTTLAVRAAQCSTQGLGSAGLATAWERIYASASFGLDDVQVIDPMNDRVDAANVGTLVLANEALGEAVRRAAAALEQAGMSVSGEEILRQVGCDLVDGAVTGAVDPRVVAVFSAAELGVRMEKLAGRLEVDGTSATTRMDEAIRTIRPGIEFGSVADLPVRKSARDQALRMTALWLDFAAEPALVDVAARLAAAPLRQVADLVDALLDARLQGRLQGLPALVALAASHEIDAVAARRARQPTSKAPRLSFSADRGEIIAGESVTLSWAASDADRCLASGDWAGPVSGSGFQVISGLTASARYRLTCAGLGGTTYREALVSVGSSPIPEAPEGTTSGESEGSAPPTSEAGTPGTSEPVDPVEPPPGPTTEQPAAPQPVAAPRVRLDASATTVARGESANLTWTSSNAASCTAAGGWGGSRPVAGTATVGPLQASTTFTLSCSGAGGTDIAMISVAVNGTVVLRWQPPTQQIDGSPLPGLSGYRIYYGSTSGSYLGYQEIGAQGGSEHSLSLPPGEYYIAMTALGLDGAESGYSNEVRKVVN